jgi:hypothetical protein
MKRKQETMNAMSNVDLSVTTTTTVSERLKWFSSLPNLLKKHLEAV